MSEKGHRKTLIKLIHTASGRTRVCTACGALFFGRCLCGRTDGYPLDRVAYEEILESVTKKRSCSDMTLRELSETLRFFNSHGFRNQPFDLNIEIRKEKDSIISSIKERASSILGNNWEGRLTGFLKTRVGVDNLSFCTLDQLRHVQGFLTTIARKSGGGR